MSGQLLPFQRQHVILRLLRQDGAVETARLARELGTSAVTVRRDLEALIDRGLARRVYGGALAAPRSHDDQPRPEEQPPDAVTGPQPPVLREVPTPRVVPLRCEESGVEHHLRYAERLLRIAERQLLRNRRADAREWRALAELHLRLAECARSANQLGDQRGNDAVRQPRGNSG